MPAQVVMVLGGPCLAKPRFAIRGFVRAGQPRQSMDRRDDKATPRLMWFTAPGQDDVGFAMPWPRHSMPGLAMPRSLTLVHSH